MWYNGDVFKILGFVYCGLSEPKYYYTSNKKRKTIEEMKNEYGLADENEHEFCLVNKWYKLYDCGLIKYVWNKTKM